MWIKEALGFEETIDSPELEVANIRELQSVFDECISPEMKERESLTAESLNIWRCVVALWMQYTQEWYVDVEFMYNQIDDLCNKWIDTILIAWTTGESSSLTKEEQITTIKLASLYAKNKWVTIIAWAGSNSTEEQSKLIHGSMWGSYALDMSIVNQQNEHRENTLFNAWASASLLLPPYYIKSSSTNLVKHLVSWLNQWPAIIYSISWRTWMEIPLEVLDMLSQHPNFIWVKECDGSIINWDKRYNQRIQYLVNKSITVWTGNDDSLVRDIHQDWAFWVISVTAGFVSEDVLNLVDENFDEQYLKNNQKAASALFPNGVPNPWAANWSWNMIDNDNSQPAIMRLPVGALTLREQRYVSDILGEIWFNLTPYKDNYKEFPNVGKV